MHSTWRAIRLSSVIKCGRRREYAPSRFWMRRAISFWSNLPHTKSLIPGRGSLSLCYGGDDHCCSPFAQISACAVSVPGSFLGYFAANRTTGQGRRICTGGKQALAKRVASAHVISSCWLRRRKRVATDLCDTSHRRGVGRYVAVVEATLYQLQLRRRWRHSIPEREK